MFVSRAHDELLCATKHEWLVSLTNDVLSPANDVLSYPCERSLHPYPRGVPPLAATRPRPGRIAPVFFYGL